MTNSQDPKFTCDTLFAGELNCMQNKKGYRFSIDAILIGHFIRPGNGEIILDLGAGGGIISLIVAYRWGKVFKSITGLELQPSLAELAKKNIAENKYENLCRIIQGDVKTILQHISPESFSMVVCNPPFYKTGSGRTTKNREAMIARHQIAANLADFISAAGVAVKNKGTVHFVFPAEGLTELVSTAQRYNLEPKNIMFVYSYPHPSNSAVLVLVKFLKNGGKGVEILPPFYIYKEKNGAYSSKMAEFYARNKAGGEALPCATDL